MNILRKTSSKEGKSLANKKSFVGELLFIDIVLFLPRQKYKASKLSTCPMQMVPILSFAKYQNSQGFLWSSADSKDGKRTVSSPLELSKR